MLDTKLESAHQRANIEKLSKAYLTFNHSDWENTKNYDDVLAAIGRNRKLIMNKFLNLEQRKVEITYEVAKVIMKEVLDNCKLRVDDTKWPLLLKFAERAGKVDFRLLMDVYRDRVYKLMNVPKTKTLFI